MPNHPDDYATVVVNNRKYIVNDYGLVTCLKCGTHHGAGRLKINVELSTDVPAKEDKR